MSLKLVLLIGTLVVLTLIVIIARRQLSGNDRAHASDAHLAGPASAHPELSFFNDLSAELRIELDTPATPIGNLQNVAAAPAAKITQLSLDASVYDEDADDSRPLTPAELDLIAFKGGAIRLRGEGGPIVEHRAADGSAFTVRELLRAVEETERQTRGDSKWFDGVDVHHIYFEGIHPDADGAWTIHWGS